MLADGIIRYFRVESYAHSPSKKIAVSQILAHTAHYNMSLIIHRFTGCDWISNCYIVFDKEESNRCMIIDPGNSDVTSLTDYISAEALESEFIILTHRHFDHCAGLNELRAMYPNAKFVCSKECNIAIQNSRLNCSGLSNMVPSFTIDSADIIYDGIGLLPWNGHYVECLPTPGHTIDSISIIIRNNVFTGDSLLKHTPVITKLPSGNKEQQKKTDEYLRSLHGMNIYPGHGENFIID